MPSWDPAGQRRAGGRPSSSVPPATPSPEPGGVPDEIINRIFAPGTAPWYEQIVEQTLKGLDGAWKERLLARIAAELGSPRRALDLACGTGLMTALVRRRFPACQVVGVDMNAEYLDLAERRAAERGDAGVRFLLGRAEEVEPPGSFDLVLTCYLPKYADLPRLIPRLVAVLDPGGLIIMQDFTWPSDRFVAEYLTTRFAELVTWSRQNLPEAVGMFETLPGVIRGSRWPEELTHLFHRHGLAGIGHESHDLEQAATVWGRKPPSRPRGRSRNAGRGRGRGRRLACGP